MAGSKRRSKSKSRSRRKIKRSPAQKKWHDLVQKTYSAGKRRRTSYTYKQAMMDAKKVYRRGSK